jgi:hypothetical protein
MTCEYALPLAGLAPYRGSHTTRQLGLTTLAP